jgi:hypothetical protein
MFASDAVACGARAINILAVGITPAPHDVRIPLAACDSVEAEANHANYWMKLARVFDGLCNLCLFDDEHLFCAPV